MQPDRKLIFVHDCREWELGRKRIVEQLSRYGFRQQDRMCISVAIDEAMINVLQRKLAGDCGSAAVAYFINNDVFHMRVRLVGNNARLASWQREINPWLLAAACMSGIRTDEDGTGVEMWKNNTVTAAASERSQRLRQGSRR